MESNEKDQNGQSVDNKSNQPINPEVKKEETNPTQPTVSQLKQPFGQGGNAPQVYQPWGTGNDHKSNVPNTEEQKGEISEPESFGEAGPEEKKGF